MTISFFWIITQTVVAISDRRFETTYRPRLQRPIGSEKSAMNYHYSLRNSREWSCSQLLALLLQLVMSQEI